MKTAKTSRSVHRYTSSGEMHPESCMVPVLAPWKLAQERYRSFAGSCDWQLAVAALGAKLGGRRNKQCEKA